MKVSQLQYGFHTLFLFQFLLRHLWQLAQWLVIPRFIVPILLISSFQVQAKPVLLVMGDSLSAAYGMNQDQGWVSLLAKKPQMQPVHVVNASLSGETTSGGKQRLKTLMAKYQPKWLILQLGANDALRGQNLKHSQQNLQEMIDTCQAPRCHLFLLGIRLPTNYGPAYDLALQKMYQQLAEQNTLLFDPFFLEDVALDANLMQTDALHPNLAAQPVILQRVWPKIQKLISMPDIKSP